MACLIHVKQLVQLPIVIAEPTPRIPAAAIYKPASENGKSEHAI